jgi:hypothetical protein
MMEAIRTSETSVLTRTAWRNIPGDGILHSHRCGNFKSYRQERRQAETLSRVWYQFPVSLTLRCRDVGDMSCRHVGHTSPHRAP